MTQLAYIFSTGRSVLPPTILHYVTVILHQLTPPVYIVVDCFFPKRLKPFYAMHRCPSAPIGRNGTAQPVHGKWCVCGFKTSHSCAVLFQLSKSTREIMSKVSILRVKTCTVPIHSFFFLFWPLKKMQRLHRSYRVTPPKMPPTKLLITSIYVQRFPSYLGGPDLAFVVRGTLKAIIN